MQLFTYAHSPFPYELQRISPPFLAYSSSLPPLPLSDNAIYNTAEAAADDEENFLITLTAFLRRRRRPMDDDRVGGALLRSLSAPSTAANINDVHMHACVRKSMHLPLLSVANLKISSMTNCDFSGKKLHLSCVAQEQRKRENAGAASAALWPEES